MGRPSGSQWVKGHYQGLKVSRSQGLKVSRSQGLKVSRSQGLKVSRFPGLKVSTSNLKLQVELVSVPIAINVFIGKTRR